MFAIIRDKMLYNKGFFVFGKNPSWSETIRDFFLAYDWRIDKFGGEERSGLPPNSSVLIITNAGMGM